MFARIWQFNAGTFAFIYNTPIISSKEESFEQGKLLENGEDKANEKLLKLNDFSGTVNLSLLILGVLLCSQKEIDPDFARITSIFLTMALVQYGQGNKFLENKFLIFIGEVSYCWYLFHWPIAAYCKLLEYSIEIKFGVCCASFLFSVLIHFLFEKHYIHWEKPMIYSTVLVLLTTNIIILIEIKEFFGVSGDGEDFQINRSNLSSFGTQHLENAFMWPSDFIENATYGYENKTKEEIVKMNEYYSTIDSDLVHSFCKNLLTTKFPSENRCHADEGANKTSKERLLVIGNSWAPNAMFLIKDECQDKFSDLILSWRPGCEPLIPVGSVLQFDCKYDQELFVKAVKEIQPDILFIISRIFKMSIISDEGSTPLNDLHFMTATRQLTEIQKYVKRQIFILDAFPLFNTSLTYALNDHLTTGKEINFESYFAIKEPDAIAKMRYSRLAAECPKCKLFDYTPQFFFNGKFLLYDPKHFVSFLSTAGHLTPPGLERVRPIFRHLCSLK